jgi:hypothetical protein
MEEGRKRERETERERDPPLPGLWRTGRESETETGREREGKFFESERWHFGADTG